MNKLLLFVTVLLALHSSSNAQSSVRWGETYKFDVDSDEIREFSASEDSGNIVLIRYKQPDGFYSKTPKEVKIHVEIFEKNSLSRSGSFTINTNSFFHFDYSVNHQFIKNHVI